LVTSSCGWSHAYQTDYVELGDQFVHLWRFADMADGHMVEIHELRDRYRADVAVLIADDADGCGLATRVEGDEDEAFAVVHHACARTNFSAVHEIGYLIGVRTSVAMSAATSDGTS
jgi:peptidyl-Asp metalloendopeptidase